ncbi:unnamed protein product [Ceutorhynchus assimilis]|uniref:Allatostatins MIP n=1 Tax=Ceutorhynchus assimilis TaxID=467358 RepID=A0A9N9MN32_9CUCU|nr:unnamed protein product [Ceutorhynchus assimilis]
MFNGPWPIVFKGKSSDIFLYAMTLAVCLELLVLVDAAVDGDVSSSASSSRKSFDENPQIVDYEYSKRGWRTDLPMWGKRGWNNLHSGWGKRDSSDSGEDEELLNNYITHGLDKRAWQRLQGGWGKRFIPSEDDMAIRQLAAALEENDNEINNIDYHPQDQDLETLPEVNKRNWRSFSDGWGKRSDKWDKFRGSWGKRQPAWNNLKGLWGKRSVTE